jgi:pantetheine-phosphate adenylyltransferase
MTQGRVAVYVGSFDPPTNGHLHVLRTATRVFDVVHLLIAMNADKTPLLSVDARCRIFYHELQVWMDEAVKTGDRMPLVPITPLPPDELTVAYAAQVGAEFLVRGVRNQLDFQYEQTIQHTNAKLCQQLGIPELETVYLGSPSNEELYTSSSLVRGLMKVRDWRRAVAPFVPASTLEALEKKRS